MENSVDYKHVEGTRRMQANKGYVARVPNRFKFNILQPYFDNEFNAHLAQNVALECLKRVKSRRKSTREIPAFVNTVRNYITYIHECNMIVFKTSHSYPHSDVFSELLLQYVLLECRILYKKQFSETSEEEVRKREEIVQKRILRVLLSVYNNYFESKRLTRKEIMEKSAKAIFDIFVELLSFPRAQFRILEEMTAVLLKKIGLFQRVNDLRGKSVTGMIDPSLSLFSTNVITSDYGTDDSSNAPSMSSPICLDVEENEIEEEPLAFIKEETEEFVASALSKPKPNSKYCWTICLDDDGRDEDLLFYSQEVESKRGAKETTSPPTDTVQKDTNRQNMISNEPNIENRLDSFNLPCSSEILIPLRQQKKTDTLLECSSEPVDYLKDRISDFRKSGNRIKVIDSILDSANTLEIDKEDLKPDIDDIDDGLIYLDEKDTQAKSNNRKPDSSRKIQVHSSASSKTTVTLPGGSKNRNNDNFDSEKIIELEDDEKPITEVTRIEGTPKIIDFIDLDDIEENAASKKLNTCQDSTVQNSSNIIDLDDDDVVFIFDSSQNTVSSSCLPSTLGRIVTDESKCEVSTTTEVQIEVSTDRTQSSDAEEFEDMKGLQEVLTQKHHKLERQIDTNDKVVESSTNQICSDTNQLDSRKTVQEMFTETVELKESALPKNVGESHIDRMSKELSTKQPEDTEIASNLVVVKEVTILESSGQNVQDINIDDDKPFGHESQTSLNEKNISDSYAEHTKTEIVQYPVCVDSTFPKLEGELDINKSNINNDTVQDMFTETIDLKESVVPKDVIESHIDNMSTELSTKQPDDSAIAPNLPDVKEVTILESSAQSVQDINIDNNKHFEHESQTSINELNIISNSYAEHTKSEIVQYPVCIDNTFSKPEEEQDMDKSDINNGAPETSKTEEAQVINNTDHNIGNQETSKTEEEKDVGKSDPNIDTPKFFSRIEDARNIDQSDPNINTSKTFSKIEARDRDVDQYDFNTDNPKTSETEVEQNIDKSNPKIDTPETVSKTEEEDMEKCESNIDASEVLDMCDVVLPSSVDHPNAYQENFPAHRIISEESVIDDPTILSIQENDGTYATSLTQELSKLVESSQNSHNIETSESQISSPQKRNRTELSTKQPDDSAIAPNLPDVKEVTILESSAQSVQDINIDNDKPFEHESQTSINELNINSNSYAEHTKSEIVQYPVCIDNTFSKPEEEQDMDKSDINNGAPETSKTEEAQVINNTDHNIGNPETLKTEEEKDVGKSDPNIDTPKFFSRIEEARNIDQSDPNINTSKTFSKIEARDRDVDQYDFNTDNPKTSETEVEQNIDKSNPKIDTPETVSKTEEEDMEKCESNINASQVLDMCDVVLPSSVDNPNAYQENFPAHRIISEESVIDDLTILSIPENDGTYATSLTQELSKLVESSQNSHNIETSESQISSPPKRNRTELSTKQPDDSAIAPNLPDVKEVTILESSAQSVQDINIDNDKPFEHESQTSINELNINSNSYAEHTKSEIVQYPVCIDNTFSKPEEEQDMDKSDINNGAPETSKTEEAQVINNTDHNIGNPETLKTEEEKDVGKSDPNIDTPKFFSRIEEARNIDQSDPNINTSKTFSKIEARDRDVDQYDFNTDNPKTSETEVEQNIDKSNPKIDTPETVSKTEEEDMEKCESNINASQVLDMCDVVLPSSVDNPNAYQENFPAHRIISEESVIDDLTILSIPENDGIYATSLTQELSKLVESSQNSHNIETSESQISSPQKRNRTELITKQPDDSAIASNLPDVKEVTILESSAQSVQDINIDNNKPFEHESQTSINELNIISNSYAEHTKSEIVQYPVCIDNTFSKPEEEQDMDKSDINNGAPETSKTEEAQVINNTDHNIGNPETSKTEEEKDVGKSDPNIDTPKFFSRIEEARNIDQSDPNINTSKTFSKIEARDRDVDQYDSKIVDPETSKTEVEQNIDKSNPKIDSPETVSKTEEDKCESNIDASEVLDKCDVVLPSSVDHPNAYQENFPAHRIISEESVIDDLTRLSIQENDGTNATSLTQELSRLVESSQNSHNIETSESQISSPQKRNKSEEISDVNSLIIDQENTAIKCNLLSTKDVSIANTNISKLLEEYDKFVNEFNESNECNTNLEKTAINKFTSSGVPETPAIVDNFLRQSNTSVEEESNQINAEVANALDTTSEVPKSLVISEEVATLEDTESEVNKSLVTNEEVTAIEDTSLTVQETTVYVDMLPKSNITEKSNKTTTEFNNSDIEMAATDCIVTNITEELMTKEVQLTDATMTQILSSNVQESASPEHTQNEPEEGYNTMEDGDLNVQVALVVEVETTSSHMDETSTHYIGKPMQANKSEIKVEKYNTSVNQEPLVDHNNVIQPKEELKYEEYKPLEKYIIMSDWNVKREEKIVETPVQSNHLNLLAFAAEMKRKSDEIENIITKPIISCDKTVQKKIKAKSVKCKIKPVDIPNFIQTPRRSRLSSSKKLKKLVDDNEEVENRRVTRSRSKSISETNKDNPDESRLVLTPQDFATGSPTKTVKIHQLPEFHYKDITDSDSNDSETNKLFIVDIKTDEISIFDADTSDEDIQLHSERRIPGKVVESDLQHEQNSRKPKTKAQRKLYPSSDTLEKIDDITEKTRTFKIEEKRSKSSDPKRNLDIRQVNDSASAKSPKNQSLGQHKNKHSKSSDLNVAKQTEIGLDTSLPVAATSNTFKNKNLRNLTGSSETSTDFNSSNKESGTFKPKKCKKRINDALAEIVNDYKTPEELKKSNKIKSIDTSVLNLAKSGESKCSTSNELVTDSKASEPLARPLDARHCETGISNPIKGRRSKKSTPFKSIITDSSSNIATELKSSENKDDNHSQILDLKMPCTANTLNFVKPFETLEKESIIPNQNTIIGTTKSCEATESNTDIISVTDIEPAKLPPKKLHCQYQRLHPETEQKGNYVSNIPSEINNISDFYCIPEQKPKLIALHPKLRNKLVNSNASEIVTIDLSKCKKNTVNITLKKLEERLGSETKQPINDFAICDTRIVNENSMLLSHGINATDKHYLAPEDIPLDLQLRTEKEEYPPDEAIDLRKRSSPTDQKEETVAILPDDEIKDKQIPDLEIFPVFPKDKIAENQTDHAKKGPALLNNNTAKCQTIKKKKITILSDVIISPKINPQLTITVVKEENTNKKVISEENSDTVTPIAISDKNVEANNLQKDCARKLSFTYGDPEIDKLIEKYSNLGCTSLSLANEASGSPTSRLLRSSRSKSLVAATTVEQNEDVKELRSRSLSGCQNRNLVEDKTIKDDFYPIIKQKIDSHSEGRTLRSSLSSRHDTKNDETVTSSNNKFEPDSEMDVDVKEKPIQNDFNDVNKTDLEPKTDSATRKKIISKRELGNPENTEMSPTFYEGQNDISKRKLRSKSVSHDSKDIDHITETNININQPEVKPTSQNDDESIMKLRLRSSSREIKVQKTIIDFDINSEDNLKENKSISISSIRKVLKNAIQNITIDESKLRSDSSRDRLKIDNKRKSNLSGRDSSFDVEIEEVKEEVITKSSKISSKKGQKSRSSRSATQKKIAKREEKEKAISTASDDSENKFDDTESNLKPSDAEIKNIEIAVTDISKSALKPVPSDIIPKTKSKGKKEKLKTSTKEMKQVVGGIVDIKTTEIQPKPDNIISKTNEAPVKRIEKVVKVLTKGELKKKERSKEVMDCGADTREIEAQQKVCENLSKIEESVPKKKESKAVIVEVKEVIETVSEACVTTDKDKLKLKLKDMPKTKTKEKLNLSTTDPKQITERPKETKSFLKKQGSKSASVGIEKIKVKTDPNEIPKIKTSENRKERSNCSSNKTKTFDYASKTQLEESTPKKLKLELAGENKNINRVEVEAKTQHTECSKSSNQVLTTANETRFSKNEADLKQSLKKLEVNTSVKSSREDLAEINASLLTKQSSKSTIVEKKKNEVKSDKTETKSFEEPLKVEESMEKKQNLKSTGGIKNINRKLETTIKNEAYLEQSSGDNFLTNTPFVKKLRSKSTSTEKKKVEVKLKESTRKKQNLDSADDSKTTELDEIYSQVPATVRISKADVESPIKKSLECDKSKKQKSKSSSQASQNKADIILNTSETVLEITSQFSELNNLKITKQPLKSSNDLKEDINLEEANFKSNSDENKQKPSINTAKVLDGLSKSSTLDIEIKSDEDIPEIVDVNEKKQKFSTKAASENTILDPKTDFLASTNNNRIESSSGLTTKIVVPLSQPSIDNYEKSKSSSGDIETDGEIVVGQTEVKLNSGSDLQPKIDDLTEKEKPTLSKIKDGPLDDNLLAYVSITEHNKIEKSSIRKRLRSVNDIQKSIDTVANNIKNKLDSVRVDGSPIRKKSKSNCHDSKTKTDASEIKNIDNNSKQNKSTASTSEIKGTVDTTPENSYATAKADFKPKLFTLELKRIDENLFKIESANSTKRILRSKSFLKGSSEVTDNFKKTGAGKSKSSKHTIVFDKLISPSIVNESNQENKIENISKEESVNNKEIKNKKSMIPEQEQLHNDSESSSVITEPNHTPIDKVPDIRLSEINQETEKTSQVADNFKKSLTRKSSSKHDKGNKFQSISEAEAVNNKEMKNRDVEVTSESATDKVTFEQEQLQHDSEPACIITEPDHAAVEKVPEIRVSENNQEIDKTSESGNYKNTRKRKSISSECPIIGSENLNLYSIEIVNKSDQEIKIKESMIPLEVTSESTKKTLDEMISEKEQLQNDSETSFTITEPNHATIEKMPEISVSENNQEIEKTLDVTANKEAPEIRVSENNQKIEKTSHAFDNNSKKTRKKKSKSSKTVNNWDNLNSSSIEHFDESHQKHKFGIISEIEDVHNKDIKIKELIPIEVVPDSTIKTLDRVVSEQEQLQTDSGFSSIITEPNQAILEIVPEIRLSEINQKQAIIDCDNLNLSSIKIVDESNQRNKIESISVAEAVKSEIKIKENVIIPLEVTLESATETLNKVVSVQEQLQNVSESNYATIDKIPEYPGTDIISKTCEVSKIDFDIDQQAPLEQTSENLDVDKNARDTNLNSKELIVNHLEVKKPISEQESVEEVYSKDIDDTISLTPNYKEIKSEHSEVKELTIRNQIDLTNEKESSASTKMLSEETIRSTTDTIQIIPSTAENINLNPGLESVKEIEKKDSLLENKISERLESAALTSEDLHARVQQKICTSDLIKTLRNPKSKKRRKKKYKKGEIVASEAPSMPVKNFEENLELTCNTITNAINDITVSANISKDDLINNEKEHDQLQQSLKEKDQIHTGLLAQLDSEINAVKEHKNIPTQSFIDLSNTTSAPIGSLETPKIVDQMQKDVSSKLSNTNQDPSNQIEKTEILRAIELLPSNNTFKPDQPHPNVQNLEKNVQFEENEAFIDNIYDRGIIQQIGDSLNNDSLERKEQNLPMKKIKKRKRVGKDGPLRKKCKSHAVSSDFQAEASTSTDFETRFVLNEPPKQKEAAVETGIHLPKEIKWNIPDATSHEDISTERVANRNTPVEEIPNSAVPINENILETVNTSSAEVMPQFSDPMTIADTTNTEELDLDSLPPEFLRSLLAELNPQLRMYPNPNGNNWNFGQFNQSTSSNNFNPRYRDISSVSIAQTITTINHGPENNMCTPEQNKNGSFTTITEKKEITVNFNDHYQNTRDPVLNYHGMVPTDNLAKEHCYSQCSQMTTTHPKSQQLKAITNGTNDHNYNSSNCDPVMSVGGGGDNMTLNDREFDNIILDIGLCEEDTNRKSWDNEQKVMSGASNKSNMMFEDIDDTTFITENECVMSEAIDPRLVTEVTWTTTEAIKNSQFELSNPIKNHLVGEPCWTPSDSIKSINSISGHGNTIAENPKVITEDIKDQWITVPITHSEVEIPYAMSSNSCSNSPQINNQEQYNILTLGSELQDTLKTENQIIPNSLVIKNQPLLSEETVAWPQPTAPSHRTEALNQPLLSGETVTGPQPTTAPSQSTEGLSFYTTHFTDSHCEVPGVPTPHSETLTQPDHSEAPAVMANIEMTTEPWEEAQSIKNETFLDTTSTKSKDVLTSIKKGPSRVKHLLNLYKKQIQKNRQSKPQPLKNVFPTYSKTTPKNWTRPANSNSPVSTTKDSPKGDEESEKNKTLKKHEVKTGKKEEVGRRSPRISEQHNKTANDSKKHVVTQPIKTAIAKSPKNITEISVAPETIKNKNTCYLETNRTNPVTCKETLKSSPTSAAAEDKPKTSEKTRRFNIDISANNISLGKSEIKTEQYVVQNNLPKPEVVETENKSVKKASKFVKIDVRDLERSLNAEDNSKRDVDSAQQRLNGREWKKTDRNSKVSKPATPEPSDMSHYQNSRIYNNVKLKTRHLAKLYSTESTRKPTPTPKAQPSKVLPNLSAEFARSRKTDDLKLKIRLKRSETEASTAEYKHSKNHFNQSHSSSSSNYHSIDKLLGKIATRDLPSERKDASTGRNASYNRKEPATNRDSSYERKDTSSSSSYERKDKKEKTNSFEDSREKRKLPKNDNRNTDELFDQLWRQGPTNTCLQQNATLTSSKSQRYEYPSSAHSGHKRKPTADEGAYWKGDRGNLRSSQRCSNLRIPPQQEPRLSYQESNRVYPDSRHSFRDGREQSHSSRKNTSGSSRAPPSNRVLPGSSATGSRAPPSNLTTSGRQVSSNFGGSSRSPNSHSSNTSSKTLLSEEERNRAFENLGKCLQGQLRNSRRNSNTDWCQRFGSFLSETETNGKLGE